MPYAAAPGAEGVRSGADGRRPHEPELVRLVGELSRLTRTDG
jgi:hypothetical protein